jgi:D-ribulokinase
MPAEGRTGGRRRAAVCFCYRIPLAALLVALSTRQSQHPIAVVSSAFALSASSMRTTPADGPVPSESDQFARLFAGIDLGTSGARISVVDDALREVYESSTPWTNSKHDDPDVWWRTVADLFQRASAIANLKEKCASICISGTSASCLLVDKASLKVVRRPCMYNYHVIQSSDSPASGVQAMDRLRCDDRTSNQHGRVPPRHTVTSPTSTLAKLLAWQAQSQVDPATTTLVHQADYVSVRAMRSTRPCGKAPDSSSEQEFVSDFHNCLKLGYDVQADAWPGWMGPLLQSAGLDASVLPSRIVSPGVPIGTVSASVAQLWGVHNHTVICGGTTDSNAAFVAAAGLRPTLGTAVTSLGSTVALKQLSTQYVEDADLGVYSHAVPTPLVVAPIANGTECRIPPKKLWLVGGASNVGCAILRKEGFSNDELVELSQAIDPSIASPYEFYPLADVGERFPVADASKAPVLDPKPESRAEYLKGLLQGIAQVEVLGYRTLERLGASPPIQRVWTSGGGSRNDKWTEMRQRLLREALPGARTPQVERAEHSEASYGAALLAASTFVTVG